MKFNRSLERPSQRGLVRLIVVAAVVVTLFASLGVDTAEAQRRKRRARRQLISVVEPKNHVPPIIIDDGSFVMDLDRNLNYGGVVEGKHKHTYPGFRIGRIKILNGEGELRYPPFLVGDACQGCKIEIWMKQPLSDPPQITITDAGEFTLETDAQLTWETDPSKPCNQEAAFKCRPTNRAHPHRLSHQGYANFQMERIRITRPYYSPWQITPEASHHAAFRIMIWKR